MSALLFVVEVVVLVALFHCAAGNWGGPSRLGGAVASVAAVGMVVAAVLVWSGVAELGTVLAPWRVVGSGLGSFAGGVSDGQG